jgi:hypothetical protein
MKTVNLIGNSGIQFLDLSGSFAVGSPATKITQSFCEIEYEDSAELVFLKMADDGRGFVNSLNGDEVIDPKTKRAVSEELIGTITARSVLECFEGCWLPVPYFRRKRFHDHASFEHGPLVWARMRFQPVTGVLQPGGPTHSIVLAFDTTFAKPEDTSYLMPSEDDLRSFAFALVTTPENSMGFLSEPWVMQWLQSCYNARKSRLGALVHLNFHLLPVALYATLLRMIGVAADFPEIRLAGGGGDATDMTRDIEVDLVLDIGNSRSCGILLQSNEGEAVTFNQNASRLKIRDLSQPDLIHEDAFPMHVEFVRPDFGPEDATIISGRSNAFDWPSLLRLGHEAVRCAVVSGSPQHPTGMSSPKRYLWDTEPRHDDDAWHLNPVTDRPKLPISNMFAMDGEALDGKSGRSPGVRACFSRASLMSFVFVELILHAMVQINSPEFRTHHGQETRRRSLRRIVVTCPTAMLQREKVALRRHACEAVKALKGHFKEMAPFDVDISVIPNPEDLRKPSETRQEWGYDEATCAQLVFVYGEIQSRFGGDAARFFRTYGRVREPAAGVEGTGSCQPSLRIASVDIGGGTTDVMVCTYTYDASSPTPVVKPKPEFWEGFNIAGDDIAKRIIERCVLPAIGDRARELGCGDPAIALNMLFGSDYGGQSASERMHRQSFANQVAMPIALAMIRHAVERKPAEQRAYRDFFEDQPAPQRGIEEYVERRIESLGGRGFRMSDMTWALDCREVELSVRQVLQKRTAALCDILAQYNCDLLLLAGRPTLMPVVRDLFVSFLPVSPDRIVNLGRYRIGTWYPFSDAKGIIHDPKTCVTIGAAVALMAGTLSRLERFRLDTSHLRTDIHSTAAYAGTFNPQHQKLDDEVLGPEEERMEGTLLFNGDTMLGMRQLPGEAWIATPIYKLRFKPASNEDGALGPPAERLRNRLPLTVTLRRVNPRPEQRENVRIAGVADCNGQQIDSKLLDLKEQSLASEAGHWLDTGSFFLSKF